MLGIVQHAGSLLLCTAFVAQPVNAEPGMLSQLGGLFVGAVPTMLLFIVLVIAYQILVQGPLSKTLAERRARTDGAMEEARKAIAQAEARAAEYADQLRQARGESFKIRESRIKQWIAERDAVLETARKAAAEKVSAAKSTLEAEAAKAKAAIQASSADLAKRVAGAVLAPAAGGSR